MLSQTPWDREATALARPSDLVPVAVRPRQPSGVLAWLTALCLLEPLVGLAWQYAFSHGFGFPPEASHQVVLFAGLWLVYCGDRWLDAMALRGRAHHTRRHSLQARHRVPFAVVWGSIALAALWYSLATLTPHDWAATLVLVLAAFAYLTCVHRRPSAPPAQRSAAPSTIVQQIAQLGTSRELWVGAIFAGGATAHAWAEIGPSPTAMLAAAGLTALAILNLAATSLVDITDDRRQGRASWALRCAVRAEPVCTGAAALAGVAALAGLALPAPQSRLWWSIGAAALAIAWVTRTSTLRPVERNHSLLDAALLLLFPFM